MVTVKNKLCGEGGCPWDLKEGNNYTCTNRKVVEKWQNKLVRRSTTHCSYKDYFRNNCDTLEDICGSGERIEDFNGEE